MSLKGKECYSVVVPSECVEKLRKRGHTKFIRISLSEAARVKESVIFVHGVPVGTLTVAY